MLSVVTPIAFFPFSRTIWIAIDLVMKPLDFDGHDDALLHPFDGAGRAFMQYVEDHGVFHDVPAQILMRDMARGDPREPPAVPTPRATDLEAAGG